MAPKRRKPSFPGGDMHIKLPPPLFKEPTAPGEVTGVNNNNGQSAQAVVPSHLLGKETFMMREALKSATVKLAEIIRYHSDVRQSRPPGQSVPPVPFALKASLGEHIERFDQLCDVVEAHLLRAITVLTRDAKREEARKEAERLEAAAKAAAEAAKAAEEAAAALANQPKPEPVTQAPENTDTDVQMQDVQVKVEIPEESPTTHPHRLQPSRLINATPTSASVNVVSLSPLQTSSEFAMMMGDEHLQQTLSMHRSGTNSPLGGENLTATGLNRLKRAPTLKLDLSSMAPLGGNDPLALSQDALPSPVTLAPKTAKPKVDDPMSAIGLSFGTGLQYPSSSTPFISNQQLPGGFAGLSGVNLGGESANLIPDLLSSLDAANLANNNNINLSTNSAASSFAPLPPAPSSTSLGSSALPQQPETSGADIDIIDLTTPIIDTISMAGQLGGGGVIDLTADSPTAPLKNVTDTAQEISDILSAGNPVGESGTEAAAGVMDDGLGLDLINESTKPSGDDLLSVLENTSQPVATGTESVENTAGSFEGMPTDATSLLASLAAVSNPDPGTETAMPEGDQTGQDNALASLGEFDLSSFPGLSGLGTEMNLDSNGLVQEDFSSMFGGNDVTGGGGMDGGLDFSGSGGMGGTDDLISGMGMDMSDLDDIFNFNGGDGTSAGLADQPGSAS